MVDVTVTVLVAAVMAGVFVTGAVTDVTWAVELLAGAVVVDTRAAVVLGAWAGENHACGDGAGGPRPSGSGTPARFSI